MEELLTGLSSDMYSDVWNDANMGEILQYLLLKQPEQPSDAVFRVVSLVPWERFENEPVA